MNTTLSTRSLNLRYALLQAAVWGTYCALLSFSTFFLLELGFSSTTVGAIAAFANIMGILAQPHAATLAGRIGAARLIAILTGIGALLGVCMLIFSYIPIAAVIILVPLIMILHSVMGPVNALGMEYANRGFYINYGLGRGVGSLGFALVSFLLGGAAQQFGMRMIPLAYTVIFCVITLLSLSFSLPRTEQKDADANNMQQKKTVTNQEKPRGVFALMRHEKQFCVFWFSYLLLMIGSNTVSTFMISIVTARGAGGEVMGTVLAFGAVLELPAMAVVARLLRRFSTRPLLRFASVFLTLKIIIIYTTTMVSGVFAAQLMQPLGYALFIPATVYYTNQTLAPQDRMLGQTLMLTANIAASVIGSLCGGFLLDAGGTALLLPICICISTLGTLLTFTIKRDATQPI